jgi:hypothetical protein
MSTTNERRRCCYHESGHAVQAWIEGEAIHRMQLDPPDNPDLEGATATGKPLHEWEPADVISHVRITLAGTYGDRLGPACTTQEELAFEKWEYEQHLLQALGMFRYPNFDNEDFEPTQQHITVVASCEDDVRAVFQHHSVQRCVKDLARLFEREKDIDGPDAEALIAAKLGTERDSLRSLLVTKPHVDEEPVSSPCSTE